MGKAAPKQGKLPQSFFLEMAPSGDFLIAAGHRVARWDRATRSVRYRCSPLKDPDSCAIRAQEDLIAVKSTSGRIKLIAADTGADVRDLGNKERGEGSNLLFSNCGEFLIDGSWDGDLIVRSAQTGRIEFERGFPGEMLTQVARHAATNRWVVLHSPKVHAGQDRPAPDYLSTWAWPFTRAAGFIPLDDSGLKKFRLSPDGSRIAINGGNTLSVLRLADGECLAKTSFEYGGKELDWSPDGAEIASVEKDVVVVRSAANLSVLASWPLEYASDVRFSPDGTMLALGSWGSGLWVTR